MMDLDELRSVQSRERQTDSLQQLRETFYQDVGEFIESLRSERERAAERADDPWNSPEVSRLSDDIETAEQTVEAIYERRVGKIVKMASLAAADMPTEDDGLTEEEERLFDALVSQIENNRAHVESVLDGDSPPPSNATDRPAEAETATSEASTPAAEADANTTEEPTAGVDAADLMGAGPDEGESTASSAPENSGAVDDGTPTPPPRDAQSGEREPDSRTETGESTVSTSRPTDQNSPADGAEDQRVPDVPTKRNPGGGDDENRSPSTDEDSGVERTDVTLEERPPQTTDGGVAVSQSRATDGAAHAAGAGDRESDPHTTGPADSDSAGVERTTVRITDDVGEIFGVDQRSYDLSSEDVVTLPEQNATPLVDSDAAERLE